MLFILRTRALILVSTTGCTTTQQATMPTDSSTSAPTSATNVVDGMEFYAKPVTNPPQAIDDGITKPKAGNVYVAFDCTVKNINANASSQNSRVGATSWTLRDTRGNVYEALIAFSSSGTIKIFTAGIDSKPGM